MSDKQTLLGKKAYRFVPLIEKCERRNTLKHQILDKQCYSGKLILNLTAESPLHIGSGYTLCEKDGKLLHFTMKRNGQIIIPGSSIKGMVRAVAEAVSHSCAVQLPGRKKLKKALPKNNDEQCKDPGNLCPACSIFGMAHGKEGYRGKVAFGEFACESGFFEVGEARLEMQEAPFKNYPKDQGAFEGNERLYYCQACEEAACETCDKNNFFMKTKAAGPDRKIKFRGRKFYTGKEDENDSDTKKHTYHEVLKPGSRLCGEIIFQNLRSEELSLLVYALGIHGRFYMRLGYGKPLQLGKVKIELKDVEDMLSRYLGEEKLTKERVEEMYADYIEKADQDQELRNAIRILEQIMGG